MSRKADEIRKRISELRTTGMPYPDICGKIDSEFGPGLECWFMKAHGVLTVWIEENSRREPVWTDGA